MKGKTCCFSGHRRLSDTEWTDLHARVQEKILHLTLSGYRNYVFGGAQGFDTLAAGAAIELRTHVLPCIRVILILPCKNQAERWSKCDRQIYEDILQEADEVNYVTEHYTQGCMHMRNRQMVDMSDLCIAYCHRETGGTAYTVQYARKKGLELLLL